MRSDVEATAANVLRGQPALLGVEGQAMEFRLGRVHLDADGAFVDWHQVAGPEQTEVAGSMPSFPAPSRCDWLPVTAFRTARYVFSCLLP